MQYQTECHCGQDEHKGAIFHINYKCELTAATYCTAVSVGFLLFYSTVELQFQFVGSGMLEMQETKECGEMRLQNCGPLGATPDINDKNSILDSSWGGGGLCLFVGGAFKLTTAQYMLSILWCWDLVPI